MTNLETTFAGLRQKNPIIAASSGFTASGNLSLQTTNAPSSWNTYSNSLQLQKGVPKVFWRTPTFIFVYIYLF